MRIGGAVLFGFHYAIDLGIGINRKVAVGTPVRKLVHNSQVN